MMQNGRISPTGLAKTITWKKQKQIINNKLIKVTLTNNAITITIRDKTRVFLEYKRA